MNKLFLSVILLFFAIEAFAQKNNFDIISYTVPPGYELIKNDNVLTYYKEDKSTGAYCNFFIYKLTPGKGEIQQDFDFAWSSQLQKPFKVTGTANMQPVATLKGWQFLMGTTKYADNGIATLAMLITFSGENKMQSICILSNSDQYKSDIENFIASIGVARDITPSTTGQNNNTKPAETPVNENPASPVNHVMGSGSQNMYSITVPPTWSLNAGGNSLTLEKNTNTGKRIIEFMSMVKSSGNLEKDMEHIFFEVFDGWSLYNSPNNLLFEKGDHEKGFTSQGLPYYRLSNSIRKTASGNGDVIKSFVILIQVGPNVAIINSADNMFSSETEMALNFLLFNLKINGIAEKNEDYKKQLIGTWASNSGLYGNSLSAATTYTVEGKYYALTQSSYTVGYDYYSDLIKKKQFKGEGAFAIKGNVLERKVSSGAATKYFIRFYSRKYGNNAWQNLMGLYDCNYDKNRIEAIFPFQKL
jgi:hypothetical protein